MFNNEKLKECRKQAGYTQLDMAMIIGVARTTYAEYEQGKIQPPLDKVQKILQALPMLRGELVDGVDDILINDDQIILIQAKNMREYTISEAQTIREVLKVLDDIDTIVKDSPLRLKDLYINELITLEEYKADLSRFNDELDKIPTDNTKVDLKAIETLLNMDIEHLYYELNCKERQMLIRSVVKQITVDKDNKMELHFL